jgi:alpha-tubulin suppressor-like RCC1 family protein
MIATALAFTAILSSCGSNSSSSPTSVPNSATIFYAHNLVFRNGTTLSTGYNGFGQLGNGELGNRSQPGPLNGAFSFKGFATGGVHSVAFLNNSSSTVMTWGYNGFGQLGNNTTTFSSTPITVKNKDLTDLNHVKAVAAGGFHTLALKDDGTLWAWGQNTLGQLGVGTAATPEILATGYSMVPVQVGTGTVAGVFTNVSSIASNGHHSLAITRTDGKVWAWGLNSSGQLGIDHVTTGSSSTPNVVSGLPSSGVSSVAAGGGFSYAVDKDGFVWAWGANNNGQLGNGTIIQNAIDQSTADQNFIPKKVLIAPGVPLTDIVQVAAGIQHGLALDKRKNVWAWGYNFFNQLGNNNQLDSPFAVKVVTDLGTALTGATDIRAFGSSSMALIGGAWYVWGDNSYGQLGNGSTGTVPLPVRMSGF